LQPLCLTVFLSSYCINDIFLFKGSQVACVNGQIQWVGQGVGTRVGQGVGTWVGQWVGQRVGNLNILIHLKYYSN